MQVIRVWSLLLAIYDSIKKKNSKKERSNKVEEMHKNIEKKKNLIAEARGEL